MSNTIYTENDADLFRDEMGEFEGHGWTPSLRQFVNSFSEEMEAKVTAWYNDTYQNDSGYVNAGAMSGPEFDDVCDDGFYD